MSRTVWKFPLHSSYQPVTINVPADAILVLASHQGGTPVLWFEVDTEAPTVAREFYVLGTGHRFPEDRRLDHRGSYQSGQFVWHIYEVIR